MFPCFVLASKIEQFAVNDAMSVLAISPCAIYFAGRPPPPNPPLQPIDHLRNDVMQHTRGPFLDQTLCEHAGGMVGRAAKQVLRCSAQ